MIRYIFLFAFCILNLLACHSDSNNHSSTSTTNAKTPASGFSIVSKSESNISFVNKLSDDPLSDKNVLSYEYYFNGAGVGIGDFNNDGLQDVFFAGNEVPNEIYINKGDFNFEKLGPEAGINKNKTWASGVSIIDINMDGYQDIYVSQQGPYSANERKNLFYINNKDLTFTESASAMGLDDPNLSTQAVFLDYDKDGDLDCYVMNESKYAGVLLKNIYEQLKVEKNMRAASGKLFENTGNLNFKDVTKKAGCLNYGYGLGLAVSDFNNDNWPDIMVVNDYTVPDFLYINQKDGTFKESIKDYTKQISYFGMGCDVADINNDGLVDIGVVDMAAEDHFRDKTLMAGMDTDAFKYYFEELGYQYQYMFNSLQLNNGNNTYSNIAAMAGILKSDWSWAAYFADFNLDGNKDFYVTNGYRRYARDNDFRNKIKKIRKANNNSVPLNQRKELYKLLPEVMLKNKLYINDGLLHFEDSNISFTHPEIETYSSGSAYADFDNDGDLDIVVSNIDQDVLILKNNIVEDTDNHYLQISLDEINPAKKLGSKVYVKTNAGLQLQEYSFVRGYESTMQEILVFGLGKEDIAKEIKIVWPDDNVQILKELKADQHVKIKYEKGSQLTSPKTKEGLLTKTSPGINFKHQENIFDDFEKEILLPQKQSAFGPAITSADVNKDGLEDVYLGSSKGYKSALYLQKPDGQFAETAGPWEKEFYSEDIDATFVDPNQDGNLDLIVISGGSGDFVGEEAKLTNRFYGNNKGAFFRIANVLPEDMTASYAIIKENIDDDPQAELLILGAAIPGKYPLSEKTVLLDYQEGKYVDIISNMIPEINKTNGLTRDAAWVDLDSDGNLELITVGEWQNINVYSKNASGQYNLNKAWNSSDKEGWWRSIKAEDLDGDGDMDLIVGNVGKNFKQKASKEHPLRLYSNDFDGNGTLDCVLAKDYNDKIVPARGKECSTEQMPFISDKFKTYNAFASASLVDILGKDKIDGGVQLKAVDFNSYILWNEGSSFKFEKLHPLAQASPVNDIEILDINKDNKKDIIIVGNDYNTEYETPRLDAGTGLVLVNQDNKYVPLSISKSGLYNPEDAKKIVKISRQKDDLFIIGNNNSKPGFYVFKK